jgi:hypothetical protein
MHVLREGRKPAVLDEEVLTDTKHRHSGRRKYFPSQVEEYLAEWLRRKIKGEVTN